jgi:hypothetical protein
MAIVVQQARWPNDRNCSSVDLRFFGSQSASGSSSAPPAVLLAVLVSSIGHGVSLDTDPASLKC